jgi:hypothetical protein
MQKLRKIPDYVGTGFTLAAVTVRNPIPIVKEIRNLYIMEREKTSHRRALDPRPERRCFTSLGIR